MEISITDVISIMFALTCGGRKNSFQPAGMTDHAVSKHTNGAMKLKMTTAARRGRSAEASEIPIDILGIVDYHTAVLMLELVEIPGLLSEYRIDGFTTVIRNDVQDLSRPAITNSREDRHVTRMALIDRTASLRTPSR
ncbi:hypothetical protein LAZ67_3004806 [Cordylochernes scorpioides]|uniref:Uncharacterized protein n=1 Tax=Cordylochernes scorpioides TaxID=51811 RepID=A0ABY6KA16_9ARAC|nr:hypothetical protein LAZ67_3004806 [Cordylochernes scorpioides]